MSVSECVFKCVCVCVCGCINQSKASCVSFIEVRRTRKETILGSAWMKSRDALRFITSCLNIYSHTHTHKDTGLYLDQATL